MRPAENATYSNTAMLLKWDSTIPYLFGGLALMLTLIVAALITLICSNRKIINSSGDGGEKFPIAGNKAAMSNDAEPKIVVIMAGDEGPTYIATPAASLAPCICSNPVV